MLPLGSPATNLGGPLQYGASTWRNEARQRLRPTRHRQLIAALMSGAPPLERPFQNMRRSVDWVTIVQQLCFSASQLTDLSLFNTLPVLDGQHIFHIRTKPATPGGCAGARVRACGSF